MSIYVIVAFLTALTSLSLGLFVFSKNTRSLTSRAWFFLSVSIAFWSFFLSFMFNSKDSATGLYYSRLLQIGASLIPLACLFFILAFLQQIDKRKVALFASSAFCLFLIVINSKFYFIKSVHYVQFLNCYYPRAGSLYILYILYFFMVPGYGTFLLIKEYGKQAGFKRNQIGYCIIASFIGFICGSTTFPLWYDIQLPPIGVNLVCLYVGIISIAIVRHKLMDIEVVIKKTLVFAGLFAFLFGIIVSVAMVTQEFVSQYILHSRYFGLAISAIIIILLHNPAYNFLVNITNRFLFQKKYDLRKVIKDFSDEALTILNLDRVCKVTVDTLVKNLYLTNCAVLLLTKDESSYELHHSIGLVDTNSYFKVEDSIIIYIKKNRNSILYESYDKYFQASEDIKRDMDKIKSKVVIPLVIHDQLVGLLSLGAKKSDEAYTAEDMDILTTLVRAVSIAISNARLFAQAAQYEKLAAIGTLASGINHEVCNPLNNISMKMQLFSESRKRGLYKDKKPTEIIDEAEDIMEYSVKEIQRVAGITSKLSGFAKPSKECAPVAINILAVVDDALDVVGHELTMNKIKIIKNIPEDLPEILADQHQIQQIFFNLIRNAAQAIKEEGSVTIDTEEFKDKVDIKITDTGSGIAKEKLNKIFEPFFTTKEKGSGFGLSIVRELVWRNNGTISVGSEISKGTTFYLEFQKAQ